MDNFEKAKILFYEGLACLEQKSFVEAERKFSESSELAPGRPPTLTNLAAAQVKLKKYKDAEKSASAALSTGGQNSSNAWLNLALAKNGLSYYHEALACYDKAIQLNPNFTEAWFNKGNALYELRRYDEALSHQDKTIQLKPDLAEAWSNKGNSLIKLKRYDEAFAHYDRAIQLNTDLADAWCNKGHAFVDLKRYDEAITHYEKAIQLNPDMDFLFGDYLHARMKVCSWDLVEESINMCVNKIAGLNPVIRPFPLLSLIDDPSVHKLCSQIYIRTKHPMDSDREPYKIGDAGEKIRIGYYSADFHNHPISYLTAQLFEEHDRHRFEIHGFSFGPNTADEMRRRISSALHEFHDVSYMGDSDIVKLSRNLGIDIAVDLTGFTQNSRTRIFARRCAPIQVNFLGHAGTMGAEYIDYVITDKIVTPVESQSDFTEKFVRMPHSYLVNDSKRKISEKVFSKKELGLPGNGFTFCCFNNNYKILPTIFDIWMRILGAIDGSVLWLYEDNPSASKNLRKEAERRKIDGDRLIFAKYMPPDEHLARLKQADLFLDTLPYNAHATASDALRMGLPLLTCLGKSFAGRVAASLLHALDLPELIADSLDNYERMAIELAVNPEKLATIKNKLDRKRLGAPLFDGKLFAEHIEKAYRKMFDRHRAGLPPDMIDVVE